MVKDATGMSRVSLAPMAGAQGEFTGIAMIRAYHDARNDQARTEILVPDAAHGTNPATAVMCGYKVREIATKSDGDIDLEILKKAIGPQTAGIMLTNPSTLGVFDRNIEQVSKMVHDAGGLLYYDGANLNAILGKVKPGDMGFDVIHMNLHKTFSTPHGGGGPGAGPVGVSERLIPFLPVPLIAQNGDQYQLLTEKDCPQSIGRLSTFMGNAGVLLRAYIYARMLGREGMKRVGEFATLNANYMMVKLKEKGFTTCGDAIRADRVRFKQALLNILSNAVKYNNDKGHIILDAERIAKNRIRISVSDNGDGISEEGINKLFTPFERLDKVNNVEGTGIGLVICKQIVELMGGSIGISSTPGSGSTFWFELNLVSPEG